MPPLNFTLADRNGLGHGQLAKDKSSLFKVRWNVIHQSCVANSTTRFSPSASVWAHLSILRADPNNAQNILFGPNANADYSVIAPGTEYVIPAVYPIIDGAWCAYDLGEWFFKSTAAANLAIMYV